MREGRPRLRPLGIADILDETVELYKTNFLLLIGIAAVVYIPASLIGALLPQQPAASFEPEGNPAEYFTNILSWAVPYAIYGLAYLVIAIPLVTGALTFGISERYLNRPATIGGCYKRMLQTTVFFPFLGAVVLEYLIILGVGVGLVLVIALAAGLLGAANIPAGIIVGVFGGIAALVLWIHVAVRLAIVEPALIVEMRGARNAVSRSWSLMKGNIAKGFSLLLIAVLVVVVVSAIITAPTTALVALGEARGSEPPSSVVYINALLSTIANVLFAPITSIVTILLYYDLRVRKEGFDLELLARDLDARTQEFNAQSAAALPREQTPAPSTEPEPPGESESTQ